MILNVLYNILRDSAIILIIIIIFYLESFERILYHPTKSKYKSLDTLFYKGIAYKLIVLHENADSIVMFSHGSIGNINALSCYVDKIAHICPNSDIIMYDYNHYGESQCENIDCSKFADQPAYPSTTYEYATNALDIYTLAMSLYRDVILWGESIGGLVNACLYGYLERHNSLRMPTMIVHQESVYDIHNTITNIAPLLTPISYLLSRSCNISVAKLYKNVQVPLFIFHSVDDDIVDYDDALELYNSIKNSNVHFIELRGRHCQFEVSHLDRISLRISC